MTLEGLGAGRRNSASARPPCRRRSGPRGRTGHRSPWCRGRRRRSGAVSRTAAVGATTVAETATGWSSAVRDQWRTCHTLASWSVVVMGRDRMISPGAPGGGVAGVEERVTGEVGQRRSGDGRRFDGGGGAAVVVVASGAGWWSGVWWSTADRDCGGTSEPELDSVAAAASARREADDERARGHGRRGRAGLAHPGEAAPAVAPGTTRSSCRTNRPPGPPGVRTRLVQRTAAAAASVASGRQEAISQGDPAAQDLLEQVAPFAGGVREAGGRCRTRAARRPAP